MTFKITEWVNNRKKVDGVVESDVVLTNIPAKIDVIYELNQKRTPKSRVE